MFKILISMLMCLILTFMVSDDVMAQTPPELDITLSMDKISYVVNGDVNNDGIIDRNDAIKIIITLENTGTKSIITSVFSNEEEQEFEKLLHFEVIGDHGTVKSLIRANDLGGGGDSSWPDTIPVVVGEEIVFLEVVPVEVIPPGWKKEIPIPNAHALYTLPSGYICVKAVINMSTYAKIFKRVGGVDYAELRKFNFAGVIESDPVCFYLNKDEDGDKYYYPEPFGVFTVADCNDNDPEVNPGKEEIIGNDIDDDCNQLTPDDPLVDWGVINVQADLHTVGTGNHPGSTKTPIIGMMIKAFDKTSTCVSNLGVSWQNYESIFNNCAYVTGRMTNGEGKASLLLPPGNYIVIGQYDPDGTGPAEPFCIGVSAGGVDSGTDKYKYLQVIVKSDGKKVPAKYTKKKGSELLIIEPEYVEWNGTVELYPFVFESLGDWTVTTSVTPPEGFVSDYESLTADVYTELKSVQFTITDIGSDWVDTGCTHEITHKGKKEKIKTKVGVKLSKELAKAKGLDRFGKKLKDKKDKKEK